MNINTKDNDVESVSRFPCFRSRAMFYILLVRFFSRKFFTLSSVIAIDKLEQSLEMMEGTNKKKHKFVFFTFTMREYLCEQFYNWFKSPDWITCKVNDWKIDATTRVERQQQKQRHRRDNNKLTNLTNKKFRETRARVSYGRVLEFG